MGKTINQLSTASSLSSGDQIVVYSSNNGDARKSALSALISFFSDSWANPEFEVQTAAPTSSGFTVTLTSSSSSIWAQIAPTGSFAAGTVVLPAVDDSVDGQEILLSFTQNITTLTINGNGATVSGVPTGIPSGGGTIRLRFDDLSSTWTCIGLATPRGARSTNGYSIDASDGGVNISATGGTNVGSIVISAGSSGSFVLTGGTSFTFPSIPVTGPTTVTTSAGVVVPFGLVGSLPSAASNTNVIRGVTDANATTSGGVVAGGGANRLLVVSDGTNWRIG
jgi:hypothetical protein